MPAQRIKDNGSHVDELDKRLRNLSSAFTDLGNTADFDQLLKIIHVPGWTTWPDILLMNTVLDAAERAAEDARSLRKALVESALAISGAAAE
jgi:hypothetical protein